MQVDPIKPPLKATGTKHLKLQYNEPHSNFAFRFNLRHCIKEGHFEKARQKFMDAQQVLGYQARAYTRPLFSST